MHVLYGFPPCLHFRGPVHLSYRNQTLQSTICTIFNILFLLQHETRFNACWQQMLTDIKVRNLNFKCLVEGNTVKWRSESETKVRILRHEPERTWHENLEHEHEMGLKRPGVFQQTWQKSTSMNTAMPLEMSLAALGRVLGASKFWEVMAGREIPQEVRNPVDKSVKLLKMLDFSHQP